MKRNRGVTIVEILVSIIIISIVMVLLFSLLSQIKEDDDENKINSNNLITQATILKEIEEDIASYGINTISYCSVVDKNPTLYSLVNNAKSRCIKITYADDYMKDNIAFLTISKTYDEYDVSGNSYVGRGEGSWKVEYQRGYYRDYTGANPVIGSWTNTKSVSRKIDGDVELTTEETNPYVTYTTDLDLNAGTIVLPIVTTDGQHFDVNASFVYSKENSIACIPNENLTCSKDTSTDYFRVNLNVGTNGRAYINSELVKWGSDAVITIIPDKRYQLSSLTCTNGWRLSSYTKDRNPQQVRLTNTYTSKPTTCTITFERHPFDVTLDATGGSVSPSTISVLYGNNYGSLPVPTKSGYTFYNWYSNNIVVKSDTTVIKEDPHTLKAKWWYSSTHQIDYYCDTGDVLSGTTCTHTIAATNSSYYTCPDGYSLSGSQCISTVNTSSYYKCTSGGTLSGSTCTLTQTATNASYYTCPDGYELSGTKCISTVAANTASECPSGGTLSGSTCNLTTSGTNSVEYTCPEGYTRNGTTCTRAAYTYDATIVGEPYCTVGTLTDHYSYGKICVASNMEGHADCISYSLSSTSETMWVVGGSPVEHCSEEICCTNSCSGNCCHSDGTCGYSYGGWCTYRRYLCDEYSETVYSCPDNWYSYSFGNCYRRPDGANYTCPNGGSVSGSTCYVPESTVDATLTVKNNCPSGYTAPSPTITYSCPSGYTQNGVKCIKSGTSYTVSGYYNCSQGYYWNNSNPYGSYDYCVSYSSNCCYESCPSGTTAVYPYAPGATSCPGCYCAYNGVTPTSSCPGGTISYDYNYYSYVCTVPTLTSDVTVTLNPTSTTCTKSYAATPVKVCPDGYTQNGTKCTKTIDATFHLKYDCPSGFSGGGTNSTCTKVYTAATKYACPANYVPTGEFDSARSCTKTIDGTFHLYYTCPTNYYGGNQLSTCSTDYVAHKNEYETCPSGGILFDTTKCLVENV